MNIFVYGSLIIPQVMRRVTGRSFSSEEAFLRGYAQFRLKDEADAALIPFPDKETDGVVYYDVDEETAGRLDAFAGARFERIEVNVETEGRAWVEAQTHILRRAQRKRLATEPWDELKFRSRDMDAFLRSPSLPTPPPSTAAGRAAKPTRRP